MIRGRRASASHIGPLFLAIAPWMVWGQAPAPSESMAQAQAPRPVVELSLKKAVEIALAPDGNTRVQLAQELVRQAESRSAQARSALLPDVTSSVSQQNMTRNLTAFGIRLQTPVPGFEIPELVGPFNVFDARAAATQRLFDFSSIRRFQAARAGVRAAQAENANTGEEVAAQVARLYLAALRADSALQTAQANVDLAQALVSLAEERRTAGTATGLDVSRAQVQYANERQLLLVAENERTRAHLELLRAMGVGLDTPLLLTDAMAYVPVEPETIRDALALAEKSRADLEAQRRREQSAGLSYSAAKWARLPSLSAFGDYGSIGTGIGDAVPTRVYGVLLRVPIFDGGRIEAQRAESLSLLRQERIRTADLREQIELSIRLAIDALQSAERQIKVAAEGLTLAEDELGHARRRFDAGVTSGIEITDAQTRLARARQNQITALFNYNLARIELAQATGTLRRTIQ